MTRLMMAPGGNEIMWEVGRQVQELRQQWRQWADVGDGLCCAVLWCRCDLMVEFGSDGGEFEGDGQMLK